MTRRHYPLRIHIAVAFTALVLAVGGVITWVSYSRGSQMLEDFAMELATRSAREAEAQLERLLSPARGAARLLALQPVANGADSLEMRMQALDSFIVALRLSSAVVSYYVGYADGDFFLVRRVAAGDEATFGAPAGTRFVVQSIERGAGEAVSRFLYLDETLARIGEAARPQALGFDPRLRPWYIAAKDAEGVVRTDPYVFFTNRKVGSTVAIRSAGGGAVVAADVELDTLSDVLVRQRMTPGTRLALFDDGLRLMGSDDAAAGVIVGKSADDMHPATLGELGHAPLGRLATFDFSRVGAAGAVPVIERASVDGRDMMLALARLDLGDPQPAFLGLAIPTDELLGEARELRNQTLLVTAGLMLTAVPFALWLAYAIARPLARLATEAEAVRRFDFDRSGVVRSVVREVDELALTLDHMRDTLARFLEITSDVAAESDFERLLPHLLEETARAVGSRSGVLYLVGKDPGRLRPAAMLRGGEPVSPAEQDAITLAEAPFGLAEAVSERRALSRPLREGEWEALGPLAGKGDGDSVITVPLFTRDQTLVGALVLSSRGKADPARLAFISALSGFAAVSLEARELIRAQKALFDAFLRLLADAIDAKSPYTGGHCARVPELARMLAQAACDARTGPYRDFDLDGEQWEAVRIACWMHDCGKVTTPEYVVDKATKLETLYDRIHEVRMRFEVLKREAEVRCWQDVAGGAPRAASLAHLQDIWRELDEDFAFVAACNLGGESMRQADLARLSTIGARTWQRTLDNRLGVGHEELARMDQAPPAPLPAAEPLLADRPEHRIARREADRFGPGNPWGFRMEVPELLYDRGEMHNLGVERGTLTAEERYKINEHIIQTIIMLSALPFPRHLADVPELAGGHHETMDGNGYPKRLTREQMSPVARMLAIADIFEALTAIDRPYKRGKTLGESLAIMARMRDAQHIDAELFELFLRSGVFRAYAERFMTAAQIDDVDIAGFLHRRSG